VLVVQHGDGSETRIALFKTRKQYEPERTPPYAEPPPKRYA
jgi:hypothetical protein